MSDRRGTYTCGQGRDRPGASRPKSANGSHALHSRKVSSADTKRQAYDNQAEPRCKRLARAALLQGRSYPQREREGGTHRGSRHKRLGGQSILQVAGVPRRNGQDKSCAALRQGMGVGVVNENPCWSPVSADGDIHTVRTRLTGWVWVTILAAQWVPCWHATR